MALTDDIKGGLRLFGKVKADKANRKAAEEARKQSFNTINSLDWEPMYASETVPQYQKTQSPVARSYLESFLAGNNPNMTFSGAPNAGVTKGNQQRAQDAMFGTMDQRVAQQRALDTQNPYKVQTPTRKVLNDQAQEAIYTGSHPDAVNTGVDQGTYKRLVKMGVIKDGDDLPFSATGGADGDFASALRSAAAEGNVADAKQLLFPKLDRPGSLLRRRQIDKTNERSRKIVEKYNATGWED